MYSETYTVKLTGATPLLLHRDNIDFSEKVRAWSKNPANKKFSVAGDDRTPAWTWIGYLYEANGLITVDADNLMSMLKDGGKKCPASSGKGSLKAATQSGILINEIGWPIISKNGEIETKKIMALAEGEVQDFEKHILIAESLGFSLFVKRARIGTSKHVRVRPRFETWSATGTVTVLDESLKKNVLQNLLSMAGRYCGLCDWRPGSASSGRFGCFTAEVE